MSEITIRAYQLYSGHGVSLDEKSADREGVSTNYRAGFTGGIVLGAPLDPNGNYFEVPLNLSVERVASGIWSFGGEASARVSKSYAFNFDIGSKVTALDGHDETGLGVTPFMRLGFIGDMFNIEGGALAYSGHRDVSAGHAYVMANMNVAWPINYFKTIFGIINSF